MEEVRMFLHHLLRVRSFNTRTPWVTAQCTEHWRGIPQTLLPMIPFRIWYAPALLTDSMKRVASGTSVCGNVGEHAVPCFEA